MLFFERKREAIDDGTENLQKFRNTVESFGLVYELEENIIYRPSNV